MLFENKVNILDRVFNWWNRAAQNILALFPRSLLNLLASYFRTLNQRELSRLAGDKLVDTENSVATRSNWISSMIDFVWKKRNALMSRSLILPVESFRATVYPLVYAVKAVVSGTIEVIRKLSRSSNSKSDSTASTIGNAERFVGASNLVSYLAPVLVSSFDPALIFEVGINMLYLADIPGGKPEWASASIIAILALWDKQEYSSARKSIVRAAVTNLNLLDLSMQIWRAWE